MRREIDLGIGSASSSQDDSNGFVNRRSPVQSWAPALGSSENPENQVASSPLSQAAGETWISIPRAPGYEASSLGRIRRVGHGPLKPRLTRKGYEIVDVVADGRPSRTIEVHVLVADAFLGPRPPGLTVDHLGAKRDNRPTKLEYVSNLVNQQRRWARVRQAEQVQSVAA